MQGTSAHTHDVVIVGGGMVGLTLAAALGRQGISAAVVERTAHEAQLSPEFDGRVSAIAQGSQRLMEAIGAWEGMAAYAQPIWDIRVSDANSPFFLDYHHREVGTEPFGWIVENRHIRKALVGALSRCKSMEIIAPADVTAFRNEEGRVQVALSDGRRLAARLLVGADGKPSRIRALAGIGAVSRAYDQAAIVCTIAHEEPHHGLAQERFLPAGPFAALPLPRGGQWNRWRSSLVWTEKAGHVPTYLRLPEEEFVQEIRERTGDYLDDIRTEGPRFSYPLGFLHAKSYVTPRLALIGDAAHAIHPIAGQGVNLGFRDVAVLAELTQQQARLGLDIGSDDMLAHYQRWRRFDSLTMLAVTDGLNRLFSNALPPLALARGLGLWSVGKAPPLKRFFMRHAMGLSGDVPALMRKAA